MKKIIAIITLSLSSLTAYADYIQGYYRKDGTYVQGYHRSSPNSVRYDNYNAQNSIYGTNPYTGKRGSQRDEYSNPPTYNRSYCATHYC